MCVVFTFRACVHVACGHIVVEHLLRSALGTEREYDYSMCTIDISPRETLKRATHYICIECVSFMHVAALHRNAHLECHSSAFPIN